MESQYTPVGMESSSSQNEFPDQGPRAAKEPLPRSLKRQNALTSSYLACEDEMSSDEEKEEEDSSCSVDLAAYFDEKGILPPDRISLCRSYANYLAQMIKQNKTRKIK